MAEEKIKIKIVGLNDREVTMVFNQIHNTDLFTMVTTRETLLDLKNFLLAVNTQICMINSAKEVC